MNFKKHLGKGALPTELTRHLPRVGLEPTTTRLKCENGIAVSFLMFSARGGIRTHEAEAVDLKSTPFDRSGTLAVDLSHQCR